MISPASILKTVFEFCTLYPAFPAENGLVLHHLPTHIRPGIHKAAVSIFPENFSSIPRVLLIHFCVRVRAALNPVHALIDDQNS